MKNSFVANFLNSLFLMLILLSIGLPFVKAQSHIGNSEQKSFRASIDSICSTINAKVGCSFLEIETQDSVSFNKDEQFSMQSVYKFPLALAIFSEVEKGNLSLNKMVFVSKKDLKPYTWSPMKVKFPKGDFEISVKELLEYTVSQSDNITCDILFKLIGGPSAVNAYMRNIGLNDIQIAYTEDQMHKNWDLQYKNWCKPETMSRLLQMFINEKCISKQNTLLLMKMMVETPTGMKRIKGNLPESAVVAHKTGTAMSDKKGEFSTINDVGIITLPNGKHLAITIFVSHSKASMEDSELVIANLAKLAFYHFSNK